MRFYKGLRINNLYQIYSNSLKQCSNPLHLPKPTSSTYCLCYKNINSHTQNLKTYKSSPSRFHTTSYYFEKEETINAPSFPDSVSEGDIRWIKSIGDAINVDDVICEIETDKTAVPVPSPIKGILSAQLLEEGSKVVAHQPLFKISDSKTTSSPNKKPIQSEQHENTQQEIPKKHEEKAGFLMQELQSVEVPQFPESVSEGDVKWVKKVGDQVKVDDVLCEIETDKTAVSVPSPFDGILQEMLFKDGDRVKSREVLCKIKLSPTKPAPAAPLEKQATSAIPTHSEVPKKSESFGVSDEVNIPSGFKQKPQFFPFNSSPQVLAPFGGKNAQHQMVPEPSSHSIQTHITGTRTELRVKMNRMRKRIAERLKEAQNTAAMLTTFNEIDMSTVMELRNKFKDEFLKKHGVKLGFMSPFVLAAVCALKQQPVVNAYITPEGEIVYRDFIDISVAVSTPKGLVVPVMRSCEHMTCADIEKTINALGEKARKGSLAIEDMDGGTFTISNGGVFGSLYGTPIINLPQSAILGMHAIVDRPVAINNKVEIRPMMYVALTYDHRLIDGREAVTFLRKIKSAIEQPASILLDI